MFKKNVTLHFEGQVECAICYSYAPFFAVLYAWLLIDVECSIISVMDGSLPKKPCKTCKNRFHAACLYKVSLALSDC